MRVVITMNNGNYVNSKADRLEIDRENNMIQAYDQDRLVAVCDLSIVLEARLAEKGEQ